MRRLLPLACLTAAWLSACGSNDSTDSPQANDSGHPGATGGAKSGAGGASSTAGGAPGTGGTVSAGGASSTGGTASTGGKTGTGGKAGTGGAPSTGGTTGAGGITATGGITSTGGTTSAGGATALFTMPMPIPPVLAPSSTDATADHYTITIRPGTAQIKPGAVTPIVGFNGIYPGPTIVAQKGRTVTVEQTNGYTENLSIHNHGQKVAASSDGHPVDYITPGAKKTYTYTNDQRASTYWYHDHAMDLTAAHVYKGIVAFYLIHDPAEDALNLPKGTYEVPLLIQDKSFTAANALSYDGTQTVFGFYGDTAVINGVANPYFDVATHKYRFRVLNGSNNRPFTLQLKSGKSFQVIGSEGGLLAAPVTVTSLDIAPSERYDIVIDFGQYTVGATDELINTKVISPTAVPDLVQFHVTTSVADTSVVPATLSSVTRYRETDAVSTTDVTFTQSGLEWQINGLFYDSARTDVTSKLNTVYIWRLRNNSGEMHPFHKHLTQFQVLDINNAAPPPAQSGWKDSVAVEAGNVVRIIFKDETFTGTYVFHCHKLEHEDHRMMLQESVGP